MQCSELTFQARRAEIAEEELIRKQIQIDTLQHKIRDLEKILAEYQKSTSEKP